MRNAKISLLIVCLGVSLIHCGQAPEGPDAVSRIKRNKKIVIATDAVNLPFVYGSGTGVQGLDVDIGNEIGKDISAWIPECREVTWVKFPFERLFELLEKGEAELVISAISITPERKKTFAFSEPYFDSGNTIARRKDDESIKGLSSLAKKKVGVQSSTTGHHFMENQKTASGVEIIKYPTLDDALGALNRTEVDAVVGDEPILTFSIHKSFNNLMTLGMKLTQEQYGVVVRKQEKELLAKVNETIARLRQSGELENLKKKWFEDVMEQAAGQRKKMQDAEAMKESPKTVTFNFIKTGGVFRMDRLDGFQIHLTSAGGRHSSKPILTDGNRGSCTFPEAIPPGDYKFNMSILQLSNISISIPKSAAKSVTFEMKIGTKGLDIQMK